jgi:hypothetical protein
MAVQIGAEQNLNTGFYSTNDQAACFQLAV